MQNKETNYITIFLHTAKAIQSEISGSITETPRPHAYSFSPKLFYFSWSYEPISSSFRQSQDKVNLPCKNKVMPFLLHRPQAK